MHKEYTKEENKKNKDYWFMWYGFWIFNGIDEIRWFELLWYMV